MDYYAQKQQANAAQMGRQFAPGAAIGPINTTEDGTLYSNAVGEKAPTQLDMIRMEADRALVRSVGITARLASIGERLVGPVPQGDTTSGSDEASQIVSKGGFIPSTEAALTRLHGQLSRIEDLLTGFEQTV